MLHTILTLVGLILMASITVVALRILSELHNDKRMANQNLLFSKMDHANLTLNGIRDNTNLLPLRQELGKWMQQRENAYAQFLASLEEARDTLNALNRAAQRIENRLMESRLLLDTVIERADSINDRQNAIGEDVNFIRKLAEEGAVEAAKSTEALIAKEDEECSEAKEPKPEPEEEPHKALGAAEKYELMKEMLEGGAEWKTIAREFGYSRSRDARRFYERYEAKNK
jgi:hypothetical protein